jgi:hypothetical protein
MYFARKKVSTDGQATPKVKESQSRQAPGQRPSAEKQTQVAANLIADRCQRLAGAFYGRQKPHH